MSKSYNLPQRIRLHREANGLSVEEFAHTIGISFNTLYRWESGESKPRGLQKKTIERILAKVEKKK